MTDDFLALPSSAPIQTSDGIRISLGMDSATIRNCQGEVWAVLGAANGLRTREEVIAAARGSNGFDINTLGKIFDDLRQIGAMRDSRNLHQSFHQATTNPQRYLTSLRAEHYAAYERTQGYRPSGPTVAQMPLSGPRQRDPLRASCRSFAKEAITVETVAELIGAGMKNAPSGGALYPITFSVVVNTASGELEAGCYGFDIVENALVQLNQASLEERNYGLNEESGVYGAPAVLVIGADLNRQTKKYANRGYRYSLIEAGIAVEKILHVTSALGLSSLVYGGFNDGALRDLLYSTDSEVWPLIAIAVGHESSEHDQAIERLHANLDSLLVGAGRIVEETSCANLWRQHGDLSFHQVLATYRPTGDDSSEDPEDRMCGGTAASFVLARTKALIECVERHASGIYRVDRTGTSLEVAPGVNWFGRESDPIIRGDTSEIEVDWVRGWGLTDRAPRYVPMDYVFYPLSPKRLGRPLLRYSNSNGVAGHTSKEEATTRALRELIERHAVLKSWYAGESPARVAISSLSDYLRARTKHWATLGYELMVHDYSTLGTPIAGVSICSFEHLPGFAFGSAASGTFYEATVKALHEAEVGLAGYRALPARKVEALFMQSPIDHGWYHAGDESRVAARFLSQGELRSSASLTEAQPDWVHAVAREIDVVGIDLEAPPSIHVVRVISPDLIPIGFGTGMEFATRDIPHFIA